MFDKFSLIAGVVLTLVGRILRQNVLLTILEIVLCTSLTGAVGATLGFGWWGVPVGFAIGLLIAFGWALVLVLLTFKGGRGRR